MTQLPWLDANNQAQEFPPADTALREPDGLLAAGGCLSPQRLRTAYSQGIFPWYSDDQPLLWWSPDPRTVIVPERIKISRSLKKSMRKTGIHFTMDKAFGLVIEACQQPRDHIDGTWITDDMKEAYCELHRQGGAHSVETWMGDELVGGLYGVASGRVFCGESMFSRATDASKAALVTLARQLTRWKFALIDCQMHTPHLESMGASSMPRNEFLQTLKSGPAVVPQDSVWMLDSDLQ